MFPIRYRYVKRLPELPPIGDKVEAAYRRGDLLEKRRVMMADWAAFLARIEQPAEVVARVTN